MSEVSLDPEEFPYPIKCGDLGGTSDINSYGWLSFTKTRKWFHKWK